MTDQAKPAKHLAIPCLIAIAGRGKCPAVLRIVLELLEASHRGVLRDAETIEAIAELIRASLLINLAISKR